MDRYCAKCGAELDENGVCPSCAEAEETAPEVTENTEPETAPTETAEPADEAVEETTEEKKELEEETVDEILEDIKEELRSGTRQIDEAEVIYEPDSEPAYSIPEAQPTQPVFSEPNAQPSKFYFTFRQFGNIIKHFFSRHTVDAVTAQFNESLPVWAIILPLCALISAVSATLSYDSSRGLSVGVGNLFTGMTLSYFEIFLVSFAVSIATQFAFSFAVMIFFKSLKQPAKFKPVANLVTSSYISVAVVNLINIITIGYFMSEYSLITTFGTMAFGILLYLGISRALGGKRPFWSFFLMMTCAFLGSMIIALVISSPIVVMRGLESLVKGLNF